MSFKTRRNGFAVQAGFVHTGNGGSKIQLKLAIEDIL